MNRHQRRELIKATKKHPTEITVLVNPYHRGRVELNEGSVIPSGTPGMCVKLARPLSLQPRWYWKWLYRLTFHRWTPKIKVIGFIRSNSLA